jgi:hypothetical protein
MEGAMVTFNSLKGKALIILKRNIVLRKGGVPSWSKFFEFTGNV